MSDRGVRFAGNVKSFERLLEEDLAINPHFLARFTPLKDTATMPVRPLPARGTQ